MPTDKRQRQKENRNSALAVRAAEERRRKLIRFGILGAILVLLIVMAIFTGGKKSGGQDGAGPAAGKTPATVACNGPQPPAAHPKQYKTRPDLTLKTGVDYSAIIHTSCGDIKMDLDENQPANVANFIFLAEQHFYDGLIWHRVELNSVIQTGDPNGINGQAPDGPGYTIPDELPAKSNEYVYGVVGMANVGSPNSAGSQFFIITHDSPANRSPGQPPEPAGYPPNYSILGTVDPSSYDVIDTISQQRTNQGASDPAEAVKPIVPVYINSIDIIEG
jgi:cyclophilin family peptidyl-prolyl cis-trans isomerase